MKTVLVTGGAGYIGSKICNDLIDRGYNVFVVDNLSTGHKKLINPKVTFYKENIINKKKIKSILLKNNIKSIIHCAASLSVSESMKKKEKYYKNNVLGTLALLEASKKIIDFFIFSSTCAVYQVSKKTYVNEKSKTLPKSYYGKTKLIGEKLIKKFSKKNKFKYAILRYFNVAGSDEKLRCGCINSNDQLFKNLSARVVRKKFHIMVYGNNYNTADGTCIRDYVHVSDISRLHIKAIDYLKNNKSFILNLGVGRGFSVLQIINAFEKIVKKKFKINFLKKRKGDIESIVSNTNKLKKIFKSNYRFKNLKEIIQSAIKWEKKNYAK